MAGINVFNGNEWVSIGGGMPDYTPFSMREKIPASDSSFNTGLSIYGKGFITRAYMYSNNDDSGRGKIIIDNYTLYFDYLDGEVESSNRQFAKGILHSNYVRYGYEDWIDVSTMQIVRPEYMSFKIEGTDTRTVSNADIYIFDTPIMFENRILVQGSSPFGGHSPSLHVCLSGGIFN